MYRWSKPVLLFALGCVLTVASAASAEPLKAGRWVLRTAGRPILMLVLRHDRSGNGGWSGALLRPRHRSSDATFTTFTAVEGPETAERITAAVPRPGALALTVRDSASNITHLLWTPSGTSGTLEFRDFPSEPLALEPAGVGEAVGNTWDKHRIYSAVADLPDNPEMTRIFDADQAARQSASIDWIVVHPQDQTRRARTKALLDGGKLRSGGDFWRAAFVFQHGARPDDYLLAHSLAIIAAARGRPDAAWIAAATLDRYLQAIGQKQVYGTQFTTRGAHTTQEPYARDLLSDALRQAIGVPTLAAQEKQRSEYEHAAPGN